MAEQSRSTVVIWVIAAGLAVFAATRLLGGGDSGAPPVRIDGGPAVQGGAASANGAGAAVTGNEPAAASGDRGSELYVHVAGAVRRPGLIRVPAGSRVATALARVGGPTRRADLTLVNLAARMQDGQQIVVPVRGAVGSGGVGPPGA